MESIEGGMGNLAIWQIWKIISEYYFIASQVPSSAAYARPINIWPWVKDNVCVFSTFCLNIFLPLPWFLTFVLNFCVCIFVCVCVCLCHCDWVLGDGCFGGRKAAINKMWRREKVANNQKPPRGRKSSCGHTSPNHILRRTENIGSKIWFQKENGKGSVTGKRMKEQPPCGSLEST